MLPSPLGQPRGSRRRRAVCSVPPGPTHRRGARSAAADEPRRPAPTMMRRRGSPFCFLVFALLSETGKSSDVAWVPDRNPTAAADALLASTYPVGGRCQTVTATTPTATVSPQQQPDGSWGQRPTTPSKTEPVGANRTRGAGSPPLAAGRSRRHGHHRLTRETLTDAGFSSSRVPGVTLRVLDLISASMLLGGAGRA